jgi:hypothetical protein
MHRPMQDEDLGQRKAACNSKDTKSQSDCRKTTHDVESVSVLRCNKI